MSVVNDPPAGVTPPIAPGDGNDDVDPPSEIDVPPMVIEELFSAPRGMPVKYVPTRGGAFVGAHTVPFHTFTWPLAGAAESTHAGVPLANQVWPNVGTVAVTPVCWIPWIVVANEPTVFVMSPVCAGSCAAISVPSIFGRVPGAHIELVVFQMFTWPVRVGAAASIHDGVAFENHVWPNVGGVVVTPVCWRAATVSNPVGTPDTMLVASPVKPKLLN